MDPLSLSGTAVGIISLGLTVCSAIFEYYDGWKSYGVDIARTSSSIQRLSQIFLQIKSVVGRETLSAAQKQCIEDNLIGCQDSLAKLEKKLKKIERQKVPANLVDHLKNTKRRLVYPFMESTLVKIREHVSEAESILDTAMSTLQLYVCSHVPGGSNVVGRDLIISATSRLELIPAKLDDVLLTLDSSLKSNSTFQQGKAYTC